MRAPLIVLVACALLLAGAYFVSRTLAGEPADVPALAPAIGAMVLTPEPAPAMAVRPSSPRPAPNRQQLEAAMAAPVQQPLQLHNPPAVDPTTIAADTAPSPYQGESKELDYAEALIQEPNAASARLLSAHHVFGRCVLQEPENKRCQAGLATTQRRLAGAAATERIPEVPRMLKNERLFRPK